MNINELLYKLEENNLKFKLYFTRKLKEGGYGTFAPNIDERIYNTIFDIVVKYIKKYENKQICPYNPTGYKDETIESWNTSDISNYESIISSFENPDCVETSIEPDEYSFYVFEIYKEDRMFPNIKIFRKLKSFKRLHSKGIVAWFNGNTLNRVDSKLIGIDGEVDFIVIDKEILILSHYSIERIFNLDSQFKEEAENFLNIEGKMKGEKLSDKIINFDSFRNDCLESTRYKKILAKMSSEDIDISMLEQNKESIVQTIELFDLNLQCVTEPSFSIEYRDKSQIMDILRILRDSYYKSIIKGQKGVDDK